MKVGYGLGRRFNPLYRDLRRIYSRVERAARPAAALAVFTRQGFRLTQMADVAREAGISVGALYSYIDGKEALLELAFAQALGEVREQDEPFRASGRANAGSALAAKLATSIRWPVLKEALEQDRLEPNSLAAIVDELFTVLTQHRHLFWLLDRCAAEVAELAGLYETAVRGRFLKWWPGWVCAATVTGSPRRSVMTLRGKPSSRSRFWLCSAETRWTKSRQSHGSR
jgi:AcrR family transcriptional regulator